MSDTQEDALHNSSIPVPPIENLAPITISQRIDAMDILRGWHFWVFY